MAPCCSEPSFTEGFEDGSDDSEVFDSRSFNFLTVGSFRFCSHNSLAVVISKSPAFPLFNVTGFQLSRSLFEDSLSSESHSDLTHENWGALIQMIGLRSALDGAAVAKVLTYFHATFDPCLHFSKPLTPMYVSVGAHRAKKTSQLNSTRIGGIFASAA